MTRKVPILTRSVMSSADREQLAVLLRRFLHGVRTIDGLEGA